MKALLMMFVAVLIGCHRIPLEERLQARTESWIGKTQGELVAVWGLPKEQGEMNGLRLMSFQKDDVRAESYRVFGRVKTPIACIARFSVEIKTETVKSGTWEGDKKLCEKWIRTARGVANDIASE